MDSDEKSTITDPEDIAWVAMQRDCVTSYLKAEKVDHGGISHEPRWFLSPYIAIWAVRSKLNADRIGWWAISGDLPTDYVTCRHEKDNADVLLTFSQEWKAAATRMATENQLPSYTFGNPESEKELAPLLLTRAELLEKFANDIKRGNLK